ncbi:MAG: hypothetical protein KatS3mg065_0621 [Chloroflexota bacterium]|nr:MAG: hypothetical protein KatS3mg065_0621 [Chloroflexota bacterium]
MADGDGPARPEAEGRLGVLPAGRAGRRVAAVGDGEVAPEGRDPPLVEDGDDEPEVLVEHELVAVGDGDAGRFLAAVLEGEEAEGGDGGGLAAPAPPACPVGRAAGRPRRPRTSVRPSRTSASSADRAPARPRPRARGPAAARAPRRGGGRPGRRRGRRRPGSPAPRRPRSPPRRSARRRAGRRRRRRSPRPGARTSGRGRRGRPTPSAGRRGRAARGSRRRARRPASSPPRPDPGPAPAEDGALGEGDGEAPGGHVLGRGDEAPGDGVPDEGLDGDLALEVDGRRSILRGDPGEGGVGRAGEPGRRLADEDDPVAVGDEGRPHPPLDVVEEPDDADLGGRGDGPGRRFVVEGDVPAGDREAEGRRRVGQAADRLFQLPEGLGAGRIAVVQAVRQAEGPGPGDGTFRAASATEKTAPR